MRAGIAQGSVRLVTRPPQEGRACLSQHVGPCGAVGMRMHDALQPRSPEQVIATLADYLHTDALCCRETDGPVADLQALVRCTCLHKFAVEAIAVGHEHDCIPEQRVVRFQIQD